MTFRFGSTRPAGSCWFTDTQESARGVLAPNRPWWVTLYSTWSRAALPFPPPPLAPFPVLPLPSSLSPPSPPPSPLPRSSGGWPFLPWVVASAWAWGSSCYFLTGSAPNACIYTFMYIRIFEYPEITQSSSRLLQPIWQLPYTFCASDTGASSVDGAPSILGFCLLGTFLQAFALITAPVNVQVQEVFCLPVFFFTYRMHSLRLNSSFFFDVAHPSTNCVALDGGYRQHDVVFIWKRA